MIPLTSKNNEDSTSAVPLATAREERNLYV